jgi:hypothetical protein
MTLLVLDLHVPAAEAAREAQCGTLGKNACERAVGRAASASAAAGVSPF